MKLIKVTAATTAAIGLMGCAANSQYPSAQQAADRAHEEKIQAQRDARDARQDAENARLDAQIARLEAQRAVLAQHEAEDNARSMAEKAAEARQRATRAEPLRSSVGVTERQLEHAAPVSGSRASVVFATGSTDLSTEAKEALDGIARNVQAQTTPMRVTIRGFGDDARMDTVNIKLSQKRAAKVAEYLEAKGVSPRQIMTMGVASDDKTGKAAGTASSHRADVAVEPAKGR